MRPYADLANLDLVQVLTGGPATVILTPKIFARIVAIAIARRAAAALLLLARRHSSTPAPTSCPRWSSASACSAAA